MAHPPGPVLIGEGVIECVEPASRAWLGVVAVDRRVAVGDVVGRSREAQQRWAQTSFAIRRTVLRQALAHVVENVDELCELIVRESGKTRENALVGEIWPVCEKLRWTIAHGERHLKPQRVTPGPLVHKRARVEFHPLGVIGAIVAWNYPFLNLISPAITALMAGNAVVVKPSEWSAWSAPRIIEVLREAVGTCGYSPDLVQMVRGDAETGRALIESGIDALVFVGSARNGAAVLRAAADRITPVVLELGGKDPFIVCDDADLDRAAHAAVAGCFISAGQNCVAPERLLVFDAAYDAFASRVAELVGALRQGDPRGETIVDVGAMATPRQLEIVERLVARAVEQGARVLVGGHRTLAEHGDYFAPTVLADITPNLEIMREETFGPVMLLCRVRDEEEAVSVANATPFGLSSSVFSRDRDRARRIATRLRTGATAINDFGGVTYLAQALPFGGVKMSGFGRVNGREGLRACCNVKAVLEERFALPFVTAMYPVAETDYERFATAIQVMYGHGAHRKLRSMVGLAHSLLRARYQRRGNGRR